MKRTLIILFAAAVAARSSAESPTGVYYSLGIPGAQVLKVGGSGEWQRQNAVYPVMSAIVPNRTDVKVPGMEITVTLDAVEAGFAADRTQPQYWLGDRVQPSRAFDTNLTFNAWLESKELQHQFVMDAEGEVYAVAGGTLVFPWLARGSDGKSVVTNKQTYVVAPSCASRPKRLFWTDPPYNSPGIDLSGKFVKFFGATEVVDPRYAVTTNGTGDARVVVSNQVSGLRLDGQGMLTVAGTTRGQFVLVYFADGNYRDVHAAQVVEVRQPYVNVMKGEIGKPLLPDGDGWLVEGLQPFPTRPSETDYLGEYFYQHKGATSYDAKNGNVYPIRPTVGERWNMEIWWKEPDAKGVYWPFECDQYACDWPEDAPVYVRGDDPDDPGASIEIPADYSVQLMDYQKPLGHAWLDDHTFASTGPGWSLLKLEAGGDVWFLPVRSVSHRDRTWFKDEAERWPVATEIRPRGAPVDGLASNRCILVDSDIPGYVYDPETTGRYNLDTLPEAIFPVNAPQDESEDAVIEVWWSQSWDGFAEDPLLFDDVMPVPVEIPSLPQRYRPVWPETAAMPEIVIASERGSRQESVCRRTGAIVFAGEGSGADLPTADYFPGGSGSFMLWTRRNGDTTGLNGDVRVERSSLIAFESLPTEDGAYERLELASTEDCGLELSHTAYSNVLETVRTVAGTTYTVLIETSVVSRVTCPSVVTNAADWLHVAVVVTNGVFEIYQDGLRAGVLSVGSVSGLVDAGVTAWLGASAFVKDCRAAAGTELAEVSTWNFALSPGRIDRLARTVLTGDEDGLTSYHSIRPNRDFEATGIPFRLLPDLVSGMDTLAYDCLRRTPGPPAYYEGIYPAGSSPKVYYRNEAGSRGYNPNEEHAFVTDDPDGTYTVWALRTDLNTSESSLPVVLVEYREDGQWRMRAHRVVVSNETFHAFAGTGTVGQMVPGPRPFNIRWATAWPTNIYWRTPEQNPCGDVPYRDRNGRLWFRAAGETVVYMYYPLDEGFWIPALAERHPAVGTPVPWLARLDDPAADILLAAPKPWAWRADWPTNGVAELEIGQTLTRNDGAAYPDVWNAASMAVVYPDPTDRGSVDETVILADPTTARTTHIGRTALEACGFRAGQGGNIVQRGSKWFFRGLPPSLSDRVWYDTEAEELTFVGRLDEDLGMLYLNVLSADERTALKSLASSADWGQAVAAIDSPPLLPNTARWKGWRRLAAFPEKADLAVTHGARDHYALTAMGRDGWVVLVENDAGKEMVNPQSAVKMHVLKAVRRYHTGAVKVRQDPNDLLSQQLSVMSSLGFAGKADKFVFEWRTCPPHADGTRPDDPDEYLEKTRGAGRTSVLVGGEASSMKDLVNTYWICRFKATNETETAWSGWFAPALAEGWLQRCLNNVTPFSQRMTDLYNNAAESAVSMIAQAGPPYLGDVALNADSLDQVGLIQLYQTLLNRAESLSLSLGPSNTNAQVNKQLLLAAERLHDLYVVLGDEARSDALNPTIGFGTSFAEVDCEVEVDYGACSSALFCFDNQLRSLLDEELALLRGRDGAELPDATEAPVFNRLVWNFTKGITAGEVAYAVNYNIDGGKSTAITANDARAAYPQGHGDAYGHYLSALKGWYRLLRNPNFDWGEPSKGEMSVDGTTVSVDYFEEAKFAEAAAKLAQTSAEIVDRTARKAWRDAGGKPGEGYDDWSDEAFGYGEWAARGGYGALCNWVAANALLPGKSEGEGLNRIDRGTVGELAEICTAADEIAHRTDTADAGLNPLGLSDDAVPFDISPIGADDGTSTHYEQIRARAGVALDNARRTLDRAQQHANRIRMLENAKSAYDSQLAEQEADFNSRLVQIFGRPYAADVGAAGTYAQGYTGPDLYHYMWMDLGQYGLASDDTVAVTELKLTPQGYEVFKESYGNFVSNYFGGAAGTLTYEFSRSGLVVKPAKTAGAKRPVNGEIQLAYGEFLAAFVSARAAETRYQEALDSLLNRLAAYKVLVSGSYKEQFTKFDQITKLENNLALYSRKLAVGNAGIDFARTLVSNVMSFMLIAKSDSLAFFGTDHNTALKWHAGIATIIQEVVESAQLGVAVNNAKSTYADTVALNNLKAELDRINRENPLKAEQYKYYLEVSEAIDALAERSTEATQTFATMVTAGEKTSEIIGRGNRILEERAAYRQRAVSKIAKARYNDMLFRQLRNRSLSQYASAFDLAQKYAFLAAKAYDYETGLLATDADRGGSFLCEIAAARSLGETRDGVPVVAEAGDGGLASALARMDVNWNTVLKGRLGINNPQRYATWFSFRWENFRIDPGETGEKAWRTELEKHWVEDLRTCPEYARYCQPFLSSGSGLQVLKEPGLVIPFSTTIDFAKNLFGQDLMDGDSFFDTAYFCTKIAAAGVWFDGSVQTKTPSVYLFPVGEDRMRAPGQDDGSYVAWNVVDQVIPVPYAIGGGGWSESDWTTWLPSYASGETGTGDSAVRIRRYPSFRAYSGGDGPDDSMLDCPRLVGRSVWNSRWMLIIPAGTLGADRDAALKTFIERVKDIRIGFRTYSNSGN